jgi:hypothetical protein
VTLTTLQSPLYNKALSPLDTLMGVAAASSDSLGTTWAAWSAHTKEWAAGIALIADEAIPPSDADLIVGPLTEYSGSSGIQVGTLNQELLELELLPRILIETVAREVFGADTEVMFYMQGGEDGPREIAEIIGQGIGSADELARLEEHLLERVLDFKPDIFEQITLVCHRRD